MIAFLEKKQKNKNRKGCLCSKLHSSPIYNSQDMEATSMSIREGMDEQEICIHNGILLGHEMNEIMPFAATGMD